MCVCVFLSDIWINNVKECIWLKILKIINQIYFQSFFSDF